MRQKERRKRRKGKRESERADIPRVAPCSGWQYHLDKFIFTSLYPPFRSLIGPRQAGAVDINYSQVRLSTSLHSHAGACLGLNKVTHREANLHFVLFFERINFKFEILSNSTSILFISLNLNVDLTIIYARSFEKFFRLLIK